MSDPTKLGQTDPIVKCEPVGMVDALTSEQMNEICQLCSRRRGEHIGRRGTYCPGQKKDEISKSTFIGTGRYQEMPKYESQRQMLVAVGPNKALYRPVKDTHADGSSTVVCFELANEDELLKERVRTPNRDWKMP